MVKFICYLSLSIFFFVLIGCKSQKPTPDPILPVVQVPEPAVIPVPVVVYKSKPTETKRVVPFDNNKVIETKGVISLVGDPKQAMIQVLFEGFPGTKISDPLVPRKDHDFFRNTPYYKKLMKEEEITRFIEISSGRTMDFYYARLREELVLNKILKPLGL